MFSFYPDSSVYQHFIFFFPSLPHTLSTSTTTNTHSKSFWQLQQCINSSFLVAMECFLCVHVFVYGIITGCMIKCQDMMTTNTFSEYGVAIFSLFHSHILPAVKMITKHIHRDRKAYKRAPEVNHLQFQYYFWIPFMRLHLLCFRFFSLYHSRFFRGFFLFVLPFIRFVKCVIFTWTVAHFWFVLCHWRTFISAFCVDCSQIKA